MLPTLGKREGPPGGLQLKRQQTRVLLPLGENADLKGRGTMLERFPTGAVPLAAIGAYGDNFLDRAILRVLPQEKAMPTTWTSPLIWE